MFKDRLKSNKNSFQRAILSSCHAKESEMNIEKGAWKLFKRVLVAMDKEIWIWNKNTIRFFRLGKSNIAFQPCYEKTHECWDYVFQRWSEISLPSFQQTFHGLMSLFFTISTSCFWEKWKINQPSIFSELNQCKQPLLTSLSKTTFSFKWGKKIPREEWAHIS